MKKFISVVIVILVLVASAFSFSAVAASVDYINIDSMEDAFPTQFGIVTQKEIVKGKYDTFYEVSVLLNNGDGIIVTTSPSIYATIVDGNTVEINQTTKKIVVRSDDPTALKTVVTNGKKYYAVFNDDSVVEMKGAESLWDYNIGMSHEEFENVLNAQKADSVSFWVFLAIIPAGIVLFFAYGLIVSLIDNVRRKKKSSNSYCCYYDDDDDDYDHY